MLGGVEIEHERGLAGHSDADVLTHAVIDALLGAAGMGDIGTLFPDDEERWRDADSIDLLRTVVGTVPGRIVNIDATLICEEPRLAPHRAEMERITRRGHLGPGQRQGDDQRGHGLDRPRRGDRLHGGRFGRDRLSTRLPGPMGTLSSIASSARQSVSDAVFEVKVLREAGILGLHRPDKSVKVASAFLRWGASPALGITTAAIHHPHETALIDERGSLTFEQAAPPLQRARPRLRGDGDRLRRRGRDHVPQPPRLRRGDPGRRQARRQRALPQHDVRRARSSPR